MWATIGAAVVVGVLGEAVADRAGLWVYRRAAYRVANVVVMFGLVMGTVATLAPAIGLAGVFALGFAIGLAYEAANLAWLRWWSFPGDRLLWLRGPTACALGVSVTWGLVPAGIAWLRGLA